MKFQRTLSAAVAAAALVGISAGISQAATSTPASAPTAKVCSAFATWEKSPTRAHLSAMIADTFTGTWTAKPAKYLAGDVSSLYGDVLSGAAPKYIKNDEKYVKSDC